MVAATGRQVMGAVLLCWAGMAGAQTIGPLEYRSVFESYRPHAVENVLPWRESNDQVGRIGGWRSYAREAQQATPAVPAGEGVQQGAKPQGSMNPESMKHGSMNHGTMNHESMKHGSMNHGTMNHDAPPGNKP